MDKLTLGVVATSAEEHERRLPIHPRTWAGSSPACVSVRSSSAATGGDHVGAYRGRTPLKMPLTRRNRFSQPDVPQLQYLQAVVAPRLVGSTPAPLR